MPKEIQYYEVPGRLHLLSEMDLKDGCFHQETDNGITITVATPVPPSEVVLLPGWPCRFVRKEIQ
jgi:hypothetical protein